MRALLLPCLLLTACATLPLSPSFDVIQQLQVRERGGLYAPDWAVAGDSHAAELAHVEAWAMRQGIVIASAPTKDLLGHSSYSGYLGWIVLVNRRLGVNDRFYTLLHELGHVLGPHNLTEPGGEVIAELVAVQTCQNLGLDVIPQTTAYLKANVPLDVQTAVAARHGRTIDGIVATLTAAATK